MEAWVVVWNGAGAHAEVGNKVALILDSSKQVEEVAAIVESLYAHYSYTLSEMVTFATGQRTNPYLAQVYSGKEGHAHVNCGHNPYLEAYFVHDLDVQTAESSDNETISWKRENGGRESFSQGWRRK